MTIQEIKNSMTSTWMTSDVVREKYDIADGDVYDDKFATASIENVLFYVVASAVWLAQQMFDRHKTDVTQILSDQTPATAAWYAWKAKQFQFGRALTPETDRYDNTGLTDEEIASERIIHYAAAVEAKDCSLLYLKIATGDAGNRQPIGGDQLTAFREYIDKVKYAGVRIEIINDAGDAMRLTLEVYYDPLVLDGTGKRLDGTGDTPVQDAIREYLTNLPFNGRYSNQALIDALQAVDGVTVAEVQQASSRYGAYTTWQPISVVATPHAGYYSLADADLEIIFHADE
jgi:hypothetical protein